MDSRIQGVGRVETTRPRGHGHGGEVSPRVDRSARVQQQRGQRFFDDSVLLAGGNPRGHVRPQLVRRAPRELSSDSYKSPFTTLPPPSSPAGLSEHLDAHGQAVWLDGEVLTFLKRSSAREVRLVGGIQQPMKRIAGSDLWIVQLRMADWSHAFLTLGFAEDEKQPQFSTWRAPAAPPVPAVATQLKGTIVSRVLHSRALGEDRRINVYLPPNAAKADLPAVFMTDGESCEAFARILEPLIEGGHVAPCAIVGVASGGYRGAPNQPYDEGQDYRAREYCPGRDRDRFARHLAFFTQEVSEYVAKEFGVSTKRQHRAVSGYSNGGSFTLAAALQNPEFAATAIPMSLGIVPEDRTPRANLPRLFFAAGQLETAFFRATAEMHDLMKAWGAQTSLDAYVAGHDFEMWRLAFADVVSSVFPAS